MTIDDSILRIAIRTRREVKIGYAEGLIPTFIVEPYTLFLDTSNKLNLYAYIWASDPVAYLKGSRDFQVDRITSIDMLDGAYDHPQQAYFDRDWKQARIVCDVFCPPPPVALETK